MKSIKRKFADNRVASKKINGDKITAFIRKLVSLDYRIIQPFGNPEQGTFRLESIDHPGEKGFAVEIFPFPVHENSFDFENLPV